MGAARAPAPRAPPRGPRPIVPPAAPSTAPRVRLRDAKAAPPSPALRPERIAPRAPRAIARPSGERAGTVRRARRVTVPPIAAIVPPFEAPAIVRPGRRVPRATDLRIAARVKTVRRVPPARSLLMAAPARTVQPARRPTGRQVTVRPIAAREMIGRPEPPATGLPTEARAKIVRRGRPVSARPIAESAKIVRPGRLATVPLTAEPARTVRRDRRANPGMRTASPRRSARPSR